MIKVAIICHFSNKQVRSILNQKIPWWESFGGRILGKSTSLNTDLAVWITNAIQEFQNRTNQVELHVLAPAAFLPEDTIEFELEGINYFFFRDEQYSLSRRLSIVWGHKRWCYYKKNREKILDYVNRIHPQIVHVIGAENPRYSLSLLDVPSSIPTILSLQTLLSDEGFKDNYPISKAAYDYLSAIELELLKKANYIASGSEKYRNIIREMFPESLILDMSLPVGERVNYGQVLKEFDFVYFARSISKAIVDALESFAIAHDNKPSITLDVIGEYTATEKAEIDKRVLELGIKDSVYFEGLLPTHQDVIKQIRKARFALLPLKVDLISGTIREAMANGLPVLTTDTGLLGTQILNKEYDCALISPIGDYSAMSSNMIRVLEDQNLENKLRGNGYKRAEKVNSNSSVIDEWIKVYEGIVDKNI